MAYRPLLLTPSDCAALLRRPVGTVWRWAHEGRLTSYDGKYDYLELKDVHEGRAKVPCRRSAAAAA